MVDLIKRLQQIDKSVLQILSIILIIFLAVLIFRRYIALAGLIIASGIFSIIIGVYHFKKFGIELVSFVTILSGVAFGAKIGGFVGFILVLFHLFFTQAFGPYIIWVIPIFTLMGVAAGIFSTTDIATLGITLIAISHGIASLFTLAMSPSGQILKYFVYIAGNMIQNIILFLYLAPIILQFIGL